MIVGILGYIGSGKGTVGDYLVDNHNFKQDSFAASLKDVCAAIFDWDREMLEGATPESRKQRDIVDEWWSEKLGIKDFTPRYALQHIATDVFRNHFHPDIWKLTLIRRLTKDTDQNVVLTDVRFPNEIALVKSMGGILVEAQRGNPPVWAKVAERANTENDEDAWREMKENFGNVHYSEWAWVGTKMDHVLDNNSTIEALYSKIENSMF